MERLRPSCHTELELELFAKHSYPALAPTDSVQRDERRYRWDGYCATVCVSTNQTVYRMEHLKSRLWNEAACAERRPLAWTLAALSIQPGSPGSFSRKFAEPMILHALLGRPGREHLGGCPAAREPTLKQRSRGMSTRLLSPQDRDPQSPTRTLSLCVTCKW